MQQVSQRANRVQYDVQRALNMKNGAAMLAHELQVVAYCNRSCCVWSSVRCWDSTTCRHARRGMLDRLEKSSVLEDA